ncbi:MAG: Asp-tRNA(Asn)/Glu-tRNA(Gln) amidotransferase subunit GatC [Rhodospirillales bacterium]|nr:Asp-tRNA(Asn)/Glu-tRNA(Gln) amidotransferase subunit GatC [Alphaproteobacteria bacterium]MCB1840752.1 Asp-tRNA(Asn)/Glu-tRNA(Gln) amidotransferase subunit GatC [Alphaproteobacteria bacterium]MCB9976787.1 Asp-tRNA(Asn)/Glu-tRNA(Gln) amidotransferase subunit GatC [Rhodospirillales bacterium]
MSLDKATVKKVAALARLAMEDEELTRMAPQVSGIITWIEQLAEVNTDSVEPLSSVVDIPLPLRKDEINDGNCAEKILANAPEATQGYFVVPKIVE